jgi:hypothetical protein
MLPCFQEFDSQDDVFEHILMGSLAMMFPFSPNILNPLVLVAHPFHRLVTH